MNLLKRLTGILLCLLVAVAASARSLYYDWTDLHKYQSSMGITCLVKLNGTVLHNCEVAAFDSKDELRGSILSSDDDANGGLCFLTVKGEGYGEVLHFRVVYGPDDENRIIRDAAETVSFRSGIIGKPFDPIIINIIDENAAQAVNNAITMAPVYTTAGLVHDEDVPESSTWLTFDVATDAELVSVSFDLEFSEGVSLGTYISRKKEYPDLYFAADTNFAADDLPDGTVNSDGSYSVEADMAVSPGRTPIVKAPLVTDDDLKPGVYFVNVTNVMLVTKDGKTIEGADTKLAFVVGFPDLEMIDVREAQNFFNTPVDVTDNPNLLIYAKEGQVTNDANVVTTDEDGKDVCVRLILHDSHNFCAQKAFVANYAEYSRTTARVGWYSVVIPFNADVPEGATIERFENLDEAACEVTVTAADRVEANVPYIFRGNGLVLTAHDVQIDTTPESPADGIFVGTYRTTAPGSIEGHYALHEDGSCFGICDANAYVPAFRAYLKAPGLGSNLRVKHDTPTGLEYIDVEATDTSTEDCSAPAAFYDLQGRRVQRPAHGLYISRNGLVLKK